jgi:hypothetical protein
MDLYTPAVIHPKLSKPLGRVKDLRIEVSVPTFALGLGISRERVLAGQRYPS